MLDPEQPRLDPDRFPDLCDADGLPKHRYPPSTPNVGTAYPATFAPRLVALERRMGTAGP
ncbi:MAG: hypothetical protein WAN74_03665 [Thermoplasmata archaeon]